MDQIYIWKLIQFIVPALLVFIGVVVAFVANNKITKIEAELKAMEEKKVAMTGSISPAKKNSKNLPKNIILLIGTNKLLIDRDLLLRGDSINPILLALAYDFPLFIKLSKDGNLLVSCTVRDLDGKIVANMINNEWEINPNNFFKRNYDENGLEVIDQDGITKLQIDFIDDSILKIGGVIIDSHEVHFISDETVISTDLRLIKKDEIIKGSDSNPNMFIYPSDKNFGKRNKN